MTRTDGAGGLFELAERLVCPQNVPLALLILIRQGSLAAGSPITAPCGRSYSCLVKPLSHMGPCRRHTAYKCLCDGRT